MTKFREDLKGHFFASSFAEWKVDEDMNKLVKFMKASRFPFAVIWVPVGLGDPYEIDSYVPVVEGCVLIAEYKVD